MASGAGASSRGGSSSGYGGGSSSSGGGGGSKRPPSPPNGGRPHAPDRDKKYHKVPEELLGFPNAVRAKNNRTPNGMGGYRIRWDLDDGCILEWDKQHGDLEKYSRGGRKHLGSFDPVTGEKIKGPVPGRTIKKYVN